MAGALEIESLEATKHLHRHLIERFPLIGELYQASDTSHPNNYFAIYTEPVLFPGTEGQFRRWQSGFESLDRESFSTFVRKSKGAVSAVNQVARGWTQLIDSVNEVMVYNHAKSLGYDEVRLVEKRHLPDIEASRRTDECLIEVKTINESEVEVAQRGRLQRGGLGLPDRLKLRIEKKYREARIQIISHPRAAFSRKICFMVINLGLATVLERRNKQLLDNFIKELESDIEIHHISRTWPADR